MKFLPLLFANFKRHKLRTLLTILSIVVAFTLFGYLAAIRNAFQFGVHVAGADRLIVRHRVSLMQFLPLAYEPGIETIDGVSDATHATFFVGIYREPKNLFPQMAVNPDEFLKMYPEFVLPPEQKRAWLQTRTGAIVGRGTAERFGFRIGDRIPLRSAIWEAKNGDYTWAFDLVGIYDGSARDTDISNFFFRHDYLEENASWGQGRVGWYLIRVSDSRRAAEIARKVDERFANSAAETKTESEAALLQGVAAQIGNVGAIVQAILAVVFFTILLVAGNTMAQTVGERRSELAVMKAIGYTDQQLLTFILAESCLISMAGGGFGLTLGWLAVSARNPIRGILPAFNFPAEDIATGAALVLLLGVVAGLLPALQAMRLNTAEALKAE